jgi:antirestriction protein
MSLSIKINGIDYSVSEYTKQDFIDMVVDRELSVGELRGANTELPLSIFDPSKGTDKQYLDEKLEAIISDDWDVLNELINNHDEDFAAACLEYANGGSLEDAEDKYMGQYDSDEDFVRETFIDVLCDASETIKRYFDWESYTSDMMHGYTEINGYYFIA